MAIFQRIRYYSSIISRCSLFLVGISSLDPKNLSSLSSLPNDACTTRFFNNPPSSTNYYQTAVCFFLAYYTLLIVYALFLSVFCYKSAVKKFTFISSVTFIFVSLVLLFGTPSLNKLSKDSLIKLKEYQPLYDWDENYRIAGLPLEPENDPKAEATLAWDSIQETFHCCGITDPKDWAQYKPDKLKAEDALPRTCCQDTTEAKIVGDGYCRAYMPRWTNNCSHEVHSAVKRIISYLELTLKWSIMFAILGVIILLCTPDEVANSYKRLLSKMNCDHILHHQVSHASGLYADDHYRPNHRLPVARPYSPGFL